MKLAPFISFGFNNGRRAKEEWQHELIMQCDKVVPFKTWETSSYLKNYRSQMKSRPFGAASTHTTTIALIGKIKAL